VRLAIEPISHWETAAPNTLAELQAFLELVPNPQLGVVIDSAHETLDGAGPECFAAQVAALAAAGRLHYVQLSPPDRGRLDRSWLPWTPFLERVLPHYNGPLAIEMFNALPVFQPLLRLSRRKYWIAGVDVPSDAPSAMDVAAASLAASRQAVAAVLATL
jgi:sugar phosphate isomerase/epimerase